MKLRKQINFLKKRNEKQLSFYMPLVVKYLVLTASHNNARVRVVAEEKLQKFLKVSQIYFF
jgi:hypothetical protein